MDHAKRLKELPGLDVEQLEVGMKVYVDRTSNGPKDGYGTGNLKGIGVVREVKPWVYHPESEGHIEVEMVDSFTWPASKGMHTFFPSELKSFD